MVESKASRAALAFLRVIVKVEIFRTGLACLGGFIPILRLRASDADIIRVEMWSFWWTLTLPSFITDDHT